jgi:hypothetical protein
VTSRSHRCPRQFRAVSDHSSRRRSRQRLRCLPCPSAHLRFRCVVSIRLISCRLITKSNDRDGGRLAMDLVAQFEMAAAFVADPARKTSRAGSARILLLRRQIRMRDHGTIDDRLARAPTADIRITWSRRIDRGAGEQPSRIKDFCSSIESMRCNLAGVDSRLRPHGDMRIP